MDTEMFVAKLNLEIEKALEVRDNDDLGELSFAYFGGKVNGLRLARRLVTDE